jgi:hypothetical protein
MELGCSFCCDPTRDRTHEYLSRNLIDHNFEFNWKKNQWYDITIGTILSINESDLWSDHSKHYTICLYISRLSIWYLGVIVW